MAIICRHSGGGYDTNGYASVVTATAAAFASDDVTYIEPIFSSWKWSA